MNLTLQCAMRLNNASKLRSMQVEATRAHGPASDRSSSIIQNLLVKKEMGRWQAAASLFEAPRQRPSPSLGLASSQPVASHFHAEISWPPTRQDPSPTSGRPKPSPTWPQRSILLRKLFKTSGSSHLICFFSQDKEDKMFTRHIARWLSKSVAAKMHQEQLSPARA